MPLEFKIIITILSILVALILIVLFFVLKIHSLMFEKRFDMDPLVTSYDDERLNRENIEFDCDSVTLRGNIYSYPDMKYKGVIVFSHGMFSSHKSYMQEIIFFANQGYIVLGFDYMGTELSDGNSLRGFGNSLKCLDYAVRFVKNNNNLNKYKIIVVGHSWGGFAASNILKYHDDIYKVVALAPFSSIYRLLKGYSPKWLYPILPIMVWVDSLKCGKYSYASNIKTLKNKENFLVLHSKDDHMVKIEYNTLKLIKKNTKIKSIILDNKRHNPNYTEEAVKKLSEYSHLVKTLDEDEVIELKKKTDFLALGELDKDIMNKIMDFIQE